MRITRLSFIVPLAVLLLGSDCDDQQQRQQVILTQQERAKVSIARLNEDIQKLHSQVDEVNASIKKAESIIVFCWDEQVVDLDNTQVCKIQAGGFFTPENQNNGQVSGAYQLPASAREDNSYCKATKIAIPQDRFNAMASNFEKGCQPVWDEHERQRKIAEDKAAVEKAAEDAEWERRRNSR
jgi:hypothetical protein